MQPPSVDELDLTAANFLQPLGDGIDPGSGRFRALWNTLLLARLDLGAQDVADVLATAPYGRGQWKDTAELLVAVSERALAIVHGDAVGDLGQHIVQLVSTLGALLPQALGRGDVARAARLS